MVITDVVLDKTLALVISLAAVKVAVTAAAVLKTQPTGAVNVNVTLVPIVISVEVPSVIFIFPNVVYKGDVAFAALSVMIDPPVAVVIAAVASAFLLIRTKRQTRRKDEKYFLLEVSAKVFRKEKSFL